MMGVAAWYLAQISARVFDSDRGDGRLDAQTRTSQCQRRGAGRRLTTSARDRLESDWMRNDSQEICYHVTATALIPARFKCWAVARVSAPQSGVIWLHSLGLMWITLALSTNSQCTCGQTVDFAKTNNNARGETHPVLQSENSSSRPALFVLGGFFAGESWWDEKYQEFPCGWIIQRNCHRRLMWVMSLDAPPSVKKLAITKKSYTCIVHNVYLGWHIFLKQLQLALWHSVSWITGNFHQIQRGRVLFEVCKATPGFMIGHWFLSK